MKEYLVPFKPNPYRGNKTMTPEQRIENKRTIDPITNCWVWNGSIITEDVGKQYGKFRVGSRSDSSRRFITAHRYSYLVYKGEIPEGMLVCHTCDNPKCFNPEHLFIGTHQDNTDDMIKKGRDNFGGKYKKLQPSKQ